MNPLTITTATFTLTTGSGATIAGTVSYDSTNFIATLTPSEPLAASTSYIATITAAHVTWPGTRSQLALSRIHGPSPPLRPLLWFLR